MFNKEVDMVQTKEILVEMDKLQETSVEQVEVEVLLQVQVVEELVMDLQEMVVEVLTTTLTPTTQV